MPKASILQVKVLSFTPDAERVCAATARQCYSLDNSYGIMSKLDDDTIKSLLTRCIKARHLSVLASASAAIVLTTTRESLTQINTHAHIKTVTQSQQYLDHTNFSYQIPEELIDDYEAKEKLAGFMAYVQDNYTWFRNRIIEKGGSKELGNEVARVVLPNGAEANTVISGNLWGWFIFLEHRCCKRNTSATRSAARRILLEFRKLAPNIFNLCGAPCENGSCPEKKPCGNPYPRRRD